MSKGNRATQKVHLALIGERNSNNYEDLNAFFFFFEGKSWVKDYCGIPVPLGNLSLLSGETPFLKDSGFRRIFEDYVSKDKNEGEEERNSRLWQQDAFRIELNLGNSSSGKDSVREISEMASELEEKFGVRVVPYSPFPPQETNTYLAVFGEGAWKNFDRIYGNLEARETDGSISDIRRGPITFDGPAISNFPDKKLVGILSEYAEDYARRKGLDPEELMASHSTWFPHAFRVEVEDMSRIGDIREELQNRYDVRTETYFLEPPNSLLSEDVESV